ncbi:Prolyl 4-hydroxylase subunit alpha-2 [Hondaea fermentalgiana]|uniref:Prolyl 4-hydroxylase subunit alpha-2 n=1 Tax=Hondaea fermentalgiana TaxID=2315210 RepID=A0A2R5GRX6_9STRA|nr:Prolyl 4-hydroxylase subunit alpha-2 [Hondaea fermentalgiana]|eukprot:GBG33632.1 Prolyl 4-hydroxylase subunit alpha-2 [Hondaea fermentalgiana]
MVRQRAAPSTPAAERAAAAAKKATAAKKAAAAARNAQKGAGSGSSKSSWNLMSALYVAIGVLVLAVVVATLQQQGHLFQAAEQPSTDAAAKRAPLPPVEDRSRGMSIKSIAERAKSLPCKNRHTDRDCHNFARHGHCSEAPGWMAVFCPASCNTCELKDPSVRCDAERIGYERTPALEPGSIDDLFANLPARYPEYNVTYLSRPPSGPWVVKFHNFLDDEEINTLINQAAGDLQRSTDQGGFSEDGVQEQVISQGRTSENAWCDDECESNPIVQRVMNRIAEATKVPQDNFESFQLLRYQIGQQYTRHHDSSASDNEMLAGPRILTFFLYLSDVEAGGGTRFTDLKPPITNNPERGSAILWPSVTNDDPRRIDSKTFHQALPVEKGTKLAANIWIHQYNYVLPNLHGCTGSFSEFE